VAFLGARDDVPEVLAALDVLVHCPREPEPFGRVLAEAMAIGRPVVAARSGGIPEIVEDGVSGVLVTPRDVPAFAAAVLKLLESAPFRERLAARGRQAAESRFAPGGHVAAVIDAYRAVLNG
jgi:glycosyltransferase involved in cell wall biosynthesis